MAYRYTYHKEGFLGVLRLQSSFRIRFGGHVGHETQCIPDGGVLRDLRRYGVAYPGYGAHRPMASRYGARKTVSNFINWLWTAS